MTDCAEILEQVESLIRDPLVDGMIVGAFLVAFTAIVVWFVHSEEREQRQQRRDDEDEGD